MKKIIFLLAFLLAAGVAVSKGLRSASNSPSDFQVPSANIVATTVATIQAIPAATLQTVVGLVVGARPAERG